MARSRTPWLAGDAPGRRGQVRPDSDFPVVVVGAGLAGLACALELDAAGVPWQIVEASDAVGGRLRTDVVDGFLLDRGFQVLLTAYPEATRVLDYDALLLQPFEPAALVRVDGRFTAVGDPRRRPARILQTLAAPVGTLGDKVRTATLAARLLPRDLADLLAAGPDVATSEWLAGLGFSPRMVERLWRPLLAGIQLDPELETSSRVTAFVLAMLARGANALPAAGIEAIPRQLVDQLDADRVLLGRRVTAVDGSVVRTAAGDELPASAVVIAVDGPSASRLVDEVADPGSLPVGCCWFAADAAPVTEPVLVLDGDRSGPVNNLSVQSRVNPSAAPAGAELIAASVLADDVDRPDDELVRDVRTQLRAWFGSAVDGWRHLRTDRIPHAQPRQPAGALTPPQRPVRLSPRRYVAGDHRDDASINGALTSGRRAAEAVVSDIV